MLSILLFESDLGDDLTVLGLTDGFKPDSTEESLRPGLPSFVHDIHVVESSAMSLVK